MRAPVTEDPRVPHYITVGMGAGPEPGAVFFEAICSCGWRSDQCGERADAMFAASAHRRATRQETAP